MAATGLLRPLRSSLLHKCQLMARPAGVRNMFIQNVRYNETIAADEIQKRSPYQELKVEIDANSSKENPMKVNAYGAERTIACVCDDMRFMTLRKGPPVKCKCGYWFELVDANKFWLKTDNDEDKKTET